MEEPSIQTEPSIVSKPEKNRILRNSLLNLLGQVVPMAVAFFAIPIIVQNIGVDRFALLSFVWALLGYFALFDLGLGRATTRQVASYIAAGRRDDASAVVLLSGALNLVFGLIWAAAIYPLVPTVVGFLNVTPSLEHEAIQVFFYVLFSLPLLTVGGTFKCALEGIHRFDLVNVVKAPFNALIFLIPVIGFLSSRTLASVVLWIVISRAAVAGVYLVFVIKQFQPFKIRVKNYSVMGHELIRFGGWITVSNVLNPIVGFAERFMISAIVSVSAVSFYAAPYEMISRLAVVPFSLALTLFPTFSGARTGGGEQSIVKEFIHTPMKYLFLIIAPVASFAVFFSKELLEVWLGLEFSSQSRLVLKLLSIGFFFNAFAYVALSAVQGLNRPDLKAKLDVIVTIFFFVSGLAFIKMYGIDGAAIVKSLTLITDTLALFWFSKSILGIGMTELFPKSLRMLSLASLAGVCLGFVLESFRAPLIVRGVCFLSVLAVLGWTFWTAATDVGERSLVKLFLSRKWMG